MNANAELNGRNGSWKPACGVLATHQGLRNFILPHAGGGGQGPALCRQLEIEAYKALPACIRFLGRKEPQSREPDAWAAAVFEGVRRLSARDGGPEVAVPILYASVAAGLAYRIVQDACSYAKTRRIAGKALVDYQLTSAKLSDLTVDESIVAARIGLLGQTGHDSPAAHVLEAVPAPDERENLREVCRSCTNILRTSFDLMAGSAFVQPRDAVPVRAVTMLLLREISFQISESRV